MTNNAYYALDTRTRWQRLLSRLFPARGVPSPDDLEGWAPSYLRTRVDGILDWKDRLRVLVSGRICVNVLTKTDVPVGRMFSESSIHVEAPGNSKEDGR